LVKEISSYLNRGTQEEEIIKQLDAEEEYYESIIELEAALEQSKKREEEAKKREEEAKKKLYESAKVMKDNGISVEIISKTTGMSKEEIEKL